MFQYHPKKFWGTIYGATEPQTLPAFSHWTTRVQHQQNSGLETCPDLRKVETIDKFGFEKSNSSRIQCDVSAISTQYFFPPLWC